MSASKSGFKRTINNKNYNDDDYENVKRYLELRINNNKNQENNIQLHKDFCNKYNLEYLNEQQFSVLINNAIRELNLNDTISHFDNYDRDYFDINKVIKNEKIINYFKRKKELKEKDKNERNEIRKLLKENNINFTISGALMTAKRDYNIYTGNKLNDIRILIDKITENRIEIKNLSYKKYNFMINYDKSPKNWRNNLVSAHRYGFKLNDPFKDLEEYFKYLEEVKYITAKQPYYKSIISKWLDKNYEEFLYLKSNIIDNENIIKSNINFSGIYC